MSPIMKRLLQNDNWKRKVSFNPYICQLNSGMCFLDPVNHHTAEEGKALQQIYQRVDYCITGFAFLDRLLSNVCGYHVT